ncbi:uncharacterized protein DS421_12g361980 [Arachis hypogaea]|nr:uncharacterized protein DS421_12g361980 [Arachis hypogaea]
MGSGAGGCAVDEAGAAVEGRREEREKNEREGRRRGWRRGRGWVVEGGVAAGGGWGGGNGRREREQRGLGKESGARWG